MTLKRCGSGLLRLILFAGILSTLSSASPSFAQSRTPQSPQSLSLPARDVPLLLRILRAEDERKVDNELLNLLRDPQANIRHRVAIALGRIGELSAVAALADTLERDRDPDVRAAAAFGIGEIAAPEGIEALSKALNRTAEPQVVHARAVEALGKIAASLSAEKHSRQLKLISDEITRVLNDETAHRNASLRRETTLAAITAALRARMSGAGPAIYRFLKSDDARIRADAANTLARLRIKGAIPQLEVLLADDDARVRANAARALGVAESRSSVEKLITFLQKESDERARISAIRALAAIKDGRALASLQERADSLLPAYRRRQVSDPIHPREINELLEIAVAFGQIGTLANDDGRIMKILQELHVGERMTAPEVEIALARLSASQYLSDVRVPVKALRDWRAVSAVGQGLGEIANATQNAGGAANLQSVSSASKLVLLTLLAEVRTPALAVPDLSARAGCLQNR
ncbi:MAG: HEAT repeat domain-containing protein [Pyrinomonadaceae bacterium]